MNTCLIVFEDARFGNFYPLTYLRPIYFLRPGMRNLCQKLIDSLPGCQPSLFCRPEIEDMTREQTEYPVNAFNGRHAAETYLINGALKPNPEFMAALKKADASAVISTPDGDIVAVKAVGQLTDSEFENLINGDLEGFINTVATRAERMTIDIPFYNYLWELMHDLPVQLQADFDYIRASRGDGYMTPDPDKYPGASFIKPEHILIAPDAEILPGTVLDASHGPILIERGGRIEPHTYVIGPLYLGEHSRLVGGKIEGSSIGPVCRIGGELEESIIQGYTNKYHAGFIGHSYVGEWVNFGAMTTNSDLKNNYKSVAVTVNGQSHDTGLLKVGSFIGDFTKTAIGTLLNTGITIGLSCNILGNGLVAEKEIPSFTWYSSRHKMAYMIVQALETIERTMSRRDKKPTDAMKRRLEEVCQASPIHAKKDRV
ncbi:MAG: hypothetical protein JW763_04535 [candidate division Zixibacteria bacterium]|nr:hypothetical protein [candidate division Zixibacteria bacterium]